MECHNCCDADKFAQFRCKLTGVLMSYFEPPATRNKAAKSICYFQIPSKAAQIYYFFWMPSAMVKSLLMIVLLVSSALSQESFSSSERDSCLGRPRDGGTCWTVWTVDLTVICNRIRSQNWSQHRLHRLHIFRHSRLYCEHLTWRGCRRAEQSCCDWSHLRLGRSGRGTNSCAFGVLVRMAIQLNLTIGINNACRPSTATALEEKYFYEDQSIVPAGPVGVIGSLGTFSVIHYF